MTNVVLTSACQIDPDSGSTLDPVTTTEPIPTSTIESSNENPLEFVEQTNTDGNFQAKIDVNYQAHDVALETAKTNEHERTNGLKLDKYHQMEIDDGYNEHPDKMKICCSMLNRLFLGLAIVCFALFLCSIAFIVANMKGLNNGSHLFGTDNSYKFDRSLTSSNKLSNDSHINLTHSNMTVVLSRRGASIKDILILYTNNNGTKQYRSIVLQGQHFGSIRFGFDDKFSSLNMTNQLPLNYRFINAHNEDWSMYRNKNNPYRVDFVNNLTRVIYELSSFKNELKMTTIVKSKLNQQIVVDPTNNIYFNLRGYGDLTTHFLNISSSTPININNAERMQNNSLIQGQFVDQLANNENYFYKFDRIGIGKNFIATLTENETKTKLNIFADHHGIIIDSSGVELSNNNTTISDKYGIRISPRQSPLYQTMSIYGPTLVVYPSQAIHTTWWQIEY